MRIQTFSLFVALLVCGCEKPPAKDTFADLYVRYDADSKELKAEAGFNDITNGEIGENKVFSNGVQFINSGMRTVELRENEVEYRAGISGLLPKEVSFTWYAQNGLPITVPAPITKINGYEVTGDTLSLSKGLSIYLNTSNLETFEKLVISISDSDGKAKNLETLGPTNTTTFKIPGAELSGLAKGEAYLYLVRSGAEEIEGETYEAILNTEYYSVPRKVEIVD